MATYEKREQPGGARVEAVERAIAILQCFETPGEALPLSVLARRSGLYKSTILRLMGSLQHTGLLQRTGENRYMLGPELRRLGALSRAGFTLEAVVRPVLVRLTAATRETASFYVRDGDERVCLFRENSPLSARHHLEEGTRHPLGSGAAGALLTHFGRPADSHPAAGEIARTGSIVSIGGRDPDLAAVAVPLLDRDGALIGSLSVSGLIGRFTDAHIEAARELLRREAAGLAARLPGRGDIEGLVPARVAAPASA